MFSKKSAAGTRPSAAEPTMLPGRSNSAAAGATFSVLGSDVAVTGDIAADADLHIDGRIEGDVTCAALVQGDASEIVGTVRVTSARLAGVVRGAIEAGELVVLKSARIQGDVTYENLTIEQGAQVDGRLCPKGAAKIAQVESADDTAKISLVS